MSSSLVDDIEIRIGNRHPAVQAAATVAVDDEGKVEVQFSSLFMDLDEYRALRDMVDTAVTAQRERWLNGRY